MHWRHNNGDKPSEKYFKVDDFWKYSDRYYNDYYVPDAPVTLKTFGICSRAPHDHIVNRYAEKYIFHYILSGKGWFNGIPFEAGDIVYCTNSRPYNLSSSTEDPCTYAWVSFYGGKSEKYIDQMGLHQTFKCYKAVNYQRIVEILYDMMEVEHENVEVALYLEACFIHLLALSMPPAPAEGKNVQSTRSDKRVRAAMEYIAEHFREPNLRLEQVAEAAHSNEKYLQRVFKSETGMSIYSYISKLRLDAAVTLLMSSNYNVNEISEYAGYNDRRTFTEAFKKAFGVSPTKYHPVQE